VNVDELYASQGLKTILGRVLERDRSQRFLSPSFSRLPSEAPGW